jgi:hypothetical protein
LHAYIFLKQNARIRDENGIVSNEQECYRKKKICLGFG